MIINYGTFNLSKNLIMFICININLIKFMFLKLLKNVFRGIKNSNYAKELYVLKPQLVSVVSNYLNILCKINEIKLHQDIKIEKNQWMIAGSILENSIINDDNLINIQKDL